MSWIRRLFLSRSPNPVSRPQRRPAFRPAVECLEDRTLLNNRFIVPFDVPADNLTNFHTLSVALASAGLFSGDTVEIELGASPGDIVNANIPAIGNLTIQGNLAVSAAEIPVFGVANPVTIAAAQAGFTGR